MQKSLERGVGWRACATTWKVDVLAYDGDAAEESANLRLATRADGLSLGDRACLALARQLDLPAVTADRSWEGLELLEPVAVVVVHHNTGI